MPEILPVNGREKTPGNWSQHTLICKEKIEKTPLKQRGRRLT